MSEKQWFPPGFLEAYEGSPDWCTIVPRPSPSPSPVVEVTEEMVTAAWQVWFSCPSRLQGRDIMRAALVAALRVR